MGNNPLAFTQVPPPLKIRDPQILSSSSPEPIFHFGKQPNGNILPKKITPEPEKGKEGTLVKKKLQQLKDTLRTIKGNGSFNEVWYFDLYIFHGTKFPVGFQLLEFKKYNGVGDPYTHLKV